MPPTAAFTINFRDFYVLAPEIVLALWGLVVLLYDVGWLRKLPNASRQQKLGWITLLGVFGALIAAIHALMVRFNLYGMQELFNPAWMDFDRPEPVIFWGTLAGDLFTETINLFLILMLLVAIRLSMAWSFTDSWGEYFALILWSTVGMMLLAAAEELLTLFLTLETMTICLYLCTSFEKNKRRSAEGGLKYFVYGSVSSALFLFGLSLLYGLTGTTELYAIKMVFTPETGDSHIGLAGNVSGMTALLLMLVGFGFKVAAVPFHQWAPDAYEGAPAPVTAWIATGSKVASFVALMKVLLLGLAPWSNHMRDVATPGWVGVVAALAAASMTFGNLAALAQRNLKRMLAYSSIAHAGYMLVGVAAAGYSSRHSESAGSVLYYLIIYGFTNLGAFAVAAWLARDKDSDDISDLNGLGFQYPGLAVCILLLMLSLIGMPPLAGFFGKLYMFMEALNEKNPEGRLTMLWLVGLGLLNSVVSAFYYVRVLKAMFLRPAEGTVVAPAGPAIALPIVVGTVVALGFGIYPAPLVDLMKSAAVPMLDVSGELIGSSLERAMWNRARRAPTGPPTDVKLELPASVAPQAGSTAPQAESTPPPLLPGTGKGQGAASKKGGGMGKGAGKGAGALKKKGQGKGQDASKDAPPSDQPKTDSPTKDAEKTEAPKKNESGSDDLKKAAPKADAAKP